MKCVVNSVLMVFPVCVAAFMLVERNVWELVAGHYLVGIDPAVGAMAIVVSSFAIPFAILNGVLKHED